MAKRFATATSPRGTFVFPHFTTPDTKYQAAGEYHTKVAFDLKDPAALAFFAKLEAVRDQFISDNPDDLSPAVIKKANINSVFEEECDQEGNETGRGFVRCKLKAKVETKTKSWTQKPALFDAQAKPITDTELQVWSGSEGKVNVEMVPYYMASTKTVGISLRLKGVQLLKVISGSTDDAGGMGFGEEDGFVAESSGFTAAPATATDTDDDDEF